MHAVDLCATTSSIICSLIPIKNNHKKFEGIYVPCGMMAPRCSHTGSSSTAKLLNKFLQLFQTPKICALKFKSGSSLQG